MEHQTKVPSEGQTTTLNPNTNSSLSTEPSPVHQPNNMTGVVSSVTSTQGASYPPGPPMVSQQYMVMIQNPTGMLPDFNVRGAYMTAHLQIICGILSVMLGIIAIVIESEDAYIGAPIWTGIFFFMSAGLTGEFAAKKRQNCLITGYLVLSILSAVAAFQLLSLMASFTAWEFGALYSSTLLRGRVAVDALTAVIALLELGVSIVASVISCRGTCCQTSTGSSMTVQYLPAVPNGGTSVLQNEHGHFVQGQPIQVTTCNSGQVAYQVQPCPMSHPPQPLPQAQQSGAYIPPYPSMEDSGTQLEDTENDQVTGMEKVPLV
ncbi:membrane-spanning 4-domains subfamily A member 8-like [Patiria miniata]|uniref:Uncharacterized protein n=1 Tax=Patiria miniata TaxID=46514 RepID=A0A914B5W2_PATMI|nr:membrane-spanning 4-domains subfamily A member 8-like [Patiria miniata]